MFVSRESAELEKIRRRTPSSAMKISFINEISDLCEEVGAYTKQVP